MATWHQRNPDKAKVIRERYRANHPDAYIESQRKSQQLRTQKTRQLKRDLLQQMGGKCVHCGLEDPCIDIYDFHHREPKQHRDLAISLLLRKATREEIFEQAKGCEVVCANCHRRIHARDECCTREPGS